MKRQTGWTEQDYEHEHEQEQEQEQEVVRRYRPLVLTLTARVLLSDFQPIEPKGFMKKYITVLFAILLAMTSVAIAAPDKEAIIAKEKAAWQAFKDKKADDFQKLISADLVAVYDAGIMNMQKELDAMTKTDMKSFSLSDFNVVMTNADTAMISYKAKVESAMEGKDTSGNYNCGSVWQMKKGQWQGVFHTDMKEAAAATK